LRVAIFHRGTISDETGTDERVTQIARSLAKEGIDVTIIGHKTTRLNLTLPENLHIIECPKKIIELYTLKWLVKLVADSLIRKYDIVQVETFTFIQSLAIFFALRPLNRKFIIVFHDKVFIDDPRKSISGKLKLFLQKILFNIYDISITPGISVKEWFKELLGEIIDRKMIVIPNGSPDTVEKKIGDYSHLREDYGIMANAFVALFFGSMSFKPNYDSALYLYGISEQISKEFEKTTGIKLVFIIAGKDSEKLPKTEYYIPIGFVDEFNKLLSLPDTVVIPHLPSFSGPHVKTMYSFLSGKPVIATIDAVKDMPNVVPKKQFLEFIVDKPDTLLTCLINLYYQKDLVSYLVLNAKTYAISSSWSHISRLHLVLYNQMLLAK
jgi:hypothetical protein